MSLTNVGAEPNLDTGFHQRSRQVPFESFSMTRTASLKRKRSIHTKPAEKSYTNGSSASRRPSLRKLFPRTNDKPGEHGKIEEVGPGENKGKVSRSRLPRDQTFAVAYEEISSPNDDDDADATAKLTRRRRSRMSSIPSSVKSFFSNHLRRKDSHSNVSATPEGSSSGGNSVHGSSPTSMGLELQLQLQYTAASAEHIEPRGRRSCPNIIPGSLEPDPPIDPCLGQEIQGSQNVSTCIHQHCMHRPSLRCCLEDLETPISGTHTKVSTAIDSNLPVLDRTATIFPSLGPDRARSKDHSSSPSTHNRQAKRGTAMAPSSILPQPRQQSATIDNSSITSFGMLPGQQVQRATNVASHSRQTSPHRPSIAADFFFGNNPDPFGETPSLGFSLTLDELGGLPLLDKPHVKSVQDIPHPTYSSSSKSSFAPLFLPQLAVGTWDTGPWPEQPGVAASRSSSVLVERPATPKLEPIDLLASRGTPRQSVINLPSPAFTPSRRQTPPRAPSLPGQSESAHVLIPRTNTPPPQDRLDVNPQPHYRSLLPPMSASTSPESRASHSTRKTVTDDCNQKSLRLRRAASLMVSKARQMGQRSRG